MIRKALSFLNIKVGQIISLPLAATPEFSNFVHVTPLTFNGTTSIDIPPAPAPPVRTAAVQ